MKDLIDIAVADSHFKILSAAFTAAKLVRTLKGPGPFTVFAPTDAAFAKLPAGTFERLLKDIPALTALLKYHVVAANLSSADIGKPDHASVPTLHGAEIKVSREGGLKLNGAVHVTKLDMAGSNGILHAIDAVLTLPDERQQE